MGSGRYYGVRFSVWSHDHSPPHVHAAYGDIKMVVDLVERGNVTVRTRKHSIQPANANKSDIRHILRTARVYHSELLWLWEERHG